MSSQRWLPSVANMTSPDFISEASCHRRAIQIAFLQTAVLQIAVGRSINVVDPTDPKGTRRMVAKALGVAR